MAPLALPRPEDADRVWFEAAGLTANVVTRVLQFGELHATSCLEYDPPFYKGLTRWARMVAQVRMELCPRGWTERDDENFSVVVSPDGTRAIAIVSGNENTGLDAQPCTRRPRGPVTQDAVRETQLALFKEVEREVRAKYCATWFLLFYPDRGEIRAELSLPERMADGWITSWKRRLRFVSVPRELRTDGPSADDEPGFDVPVSPR
jgi:hypothetical protein